MDVSLTQVGVHKFTNRRRKHEPSDVSVQLSSFPTNFGLVLKNDPPKPLEMAAAAVPKKFRQRVRALVKVCPVVGDLPSCLSCDVPNNKIVVQQTTGTQKSFSFDAVYPQETSLAEMRSGSIGEILNAVAQGYNGCIFCYGQAGLGKTYTMLGIDDASVNLGVIPCAISWIYSLMNDQVGKRNSKFSVRVSAIEIAGKRETVRDLLANFPAGHGNIRKLSSEIFFQEDPIGVIRIENQTELWAPSAVHAAHYLDAAIASRTVPDSNCDDSMMSHFRFTLHIYHYRIGQVSRKAYGGQSRLHFLDLSSCDCKEGGGCHDNSISNLGTILLSSIAGQRHLLKKESSLSQMICESMGNESCQACMIAHVSPSIHSLPETLQVLKIASRIHRLHSKEPSKELSGTSSDDSNYERYSIRNRTAEGKSSSDPEYVSSSEHSCDTVIYVGKCSHSIQANCRESYLRTPLNCSRIPKCSKISEAEEIRGCRCPAARHKSPSSLNAVNHECQNSIDDNNSSSKVIFHPADSRHSGNSKQDKRQKDSGVLSLLDSYQRINCIRHDPVGDECRQNVDEKSVNSSEAVLLPSENKMSCSQKPLESFHCRVKRGKLQQLFNPANLLKQNELWVDGPNVDCCTESSNILIRKNNSNSEKELTGDHKLGKSLQHSMRENNVFRSLEESKQILAPQFIVTKKTNTERMNISELNLVKDIDAETLYEETENRGDSKRITKQCKLLADSNRPKYFLTTVRIPHSQSQRPDGNPSRDKSLISDGLSTTETRSCGKKMQCDCLADADKHSIFFKPSSQIYTSPICRRRFRHFPESPAAEDERSNIDGSAASQIPTSDVAFHVGSKENCVNHLLSEVDHCDRTAHWVKSVPHASASRFVQQLHSRKELLRSLRIQKHDQGLTELPTADFFQSCKVLATFDQPVTRELHSGDDSSPPPAYELSSSRANSILDINENEEGASKYGPKNCRAREHLVKEIGNNLRCDSSMTRRTCRQISTDSEQIYQDKRPEKKRLVDCLRGTILSCGKSTAVHDLDDNISQTPCGGNIANQLNFLAENKSYVQFDLPSEISMFSLPDSASDPNLICELEDRIEPSEHISEAQNMSHEHGTSVDPVADEQVLLDNPSITNSHRYLSDTVTSIPKSTISDEIHCDTILTYCNVKQYSDFINCCKSKSIMSCSVSDSNLAQLESSFIKISHDYNYQSLKVCFCNRVKQFSTFRASLPNSICCKHEPNFSLKCCHRSCMVKSSLSSTLQNRDFADLMKEKTAIAGLSGHFHSQSSEDIATLKDRHKFLTISQDQKTDSFCLVTPNTSCQLMICPGNNSVSSVSSFCACKRDNFQYSQPRTSEELSTEEFGEAKESGIYDDQTWIPKHSQMKNLISCPSPENVEYLLHSKDQLEKDLEAVKDLLMIDRNRWSFDLSLTEELDSNDPSYLEALQQKAMVLERRVSAYKSRIMIVTVFDIST